MAIPLACFGSLNIARGDASQPIRTSEVLAWLEVQGYTDPDYRAEIHDCVIRMDYAWRVAVGGKQSERAGV